MKLDPHGQPPPSLNEAQNARKAVDELYGLVKGMLVDRVLSTDEIRFLANWLGRNLKILDEWPVSEVARQVAKCLDDGHVTEHEADELAQVLDRLIGGDCRDGSEGNLATRLPCDDSATPIVFRNKSFCFTGKFHFGERKRCQSCTSEVGGIIKKYVTTDLDYLVIGTLASRDWAHTNHGRKIEAVINNRRERRSKTMIVSEEHWIGCLAAASQARGSFV